MYNLFFSKNISEFITADILFCFLIFFMCCFVCVWLCICIHQFLCTIWWVLTNAYSGIITTTTLSIEIASIPQNVSYCPFCECPHLSHHPLESDKYGPSLDHVAIPSLKFHINGTMQHTVFVSAFFSHPLSMNTFEIHPCNYSSRYFLCIYCQTVFFCMDVLWYFYSLSRLQNCELYSSFSYYEGSHCEYLNISLRKFI